MNYKINGERLSGEYELCEYLESILSLEHTENGIMVFNNNNGKYYDIGYLENEDNPAGFIEELAEILEDYKVGDTITKCGITIKVVE